MYNLQDLFNKIKIFIFKDDMKKITTNKLYTCCLYIFNLLDEESLIYAKIAYNLNMIYENKIKSVILDKIIVSLYCIICANNTLQYLPCMLNKYLYNNKITPHIIFGEGVTYLSCLILMSEANKLLLTLPKDINKLDIIKCININISTYRNNSESTKNFGNIQNLDLSKDSLDFKNVILSCLIKSLLIILNKNSQVIESNNNNISELSKTIMENPNDIENSKKLLNTLRNNLECIKNVDRI